MARVGNGLGSQPSGRPTAGPNDYEVEWADVCRVEPNAATKAKALAEVELAKSEGREPGSFPIGPDDLDVVVYHCYHVRKPGGVVLAGGLIPQANIPVREVDRQPFAWLIAETEKRFKGTASETEH